jgi:hypothetical protein
VTASLYLPPIASLMHRLDYDKNLNLFYLINFLTNYHVPNVYGSQGHYQKLMDKYGKLINRINYNDYQYKVGAIPKEFRIEHSVNIPKYVVLINNLNQLPNYEQRNIVNLIWFILYCKKHKLDSQASHDIWKHYSILIEEIKFRTEDLE